MSRVGGARTTLPERTRPAAWWRNRRIWTLVAATLALIGVAAGYGAYALHRHATAPPAGTHGTLTLSDPSRLLYVSTAIGPDSDHLAEVPRALPGTTPVVGPQSCERAYTAGGTLICLRLQGTLTPSLYADVYRSTSASAQPLRQVALPGVPSRARVSPDGRLVAWTVFVSGDAYSVPAFSTRTGILDLRTGTLTSSLETFTAYVNGQVYRAVDINYWGVTFASDDRTFYVTMGSRGQTWLMRGDLTTHQLHAITTNVECPSLSPDGTRIVFKKRVSGSITAPWRLYVINLATLKETPLAETRSVDDQAAWIGDDAVAYALPNQASSDDIWTVPADGTGTPRLLVHNGASPSPVSAAAGR